MEQVLEQIQQLLAVYGLKVVAAIAIFVIGRWVARLIRQVVERLMKRSNVDQTLIGFVAGLSYAVVLVFVVLAALNQLGIQTTSFIAIIGAAGLAVGLALQGSLQNFASGFLLILFRPFKVGDFIEGAGVAGVVDRIDIFATVLKTGDNKLIIVPNSGLTGGNITNYSAQETRRVELVVGVGYDDDLKKVKAVLGELIEAEARVLKDPTPLVAVSELADSSVNLIVRIWVKTADYWGVYFAMTEAVKLRFDEEGISIPYPQRDVHLLQEAANG